MTLKSVSRLLFWPTVICVLVGSLVSGDDPPSTKTSVSAEQHAAFDADPVVKKANAAFEAEMKLVESVYFTAKRKATEKRLAVYRAQLKAFTKAGDFDKAMACKAALESSGLDFSRPQPKDLVKFDGHTYALITEPATWYVAKRRCEEMGGHLAYCKSGKEYAFLYKMSGKNSIYLGATDEEREGLWRWHDGTLWMPNTWETDNGGSGSLGPQHFLTLDGNRNVLNDVSGSERLPYICEWDN